MAGHFIGLIFESTVGLILFLVVTFRELPLIRLDEFREKMFAVRADLFDYALSGKIDFSHPAYRLLRQSMNGFIRYAHNITLFRICTNLVIWKTVQYTPKLSWTKDWENALESIKDEEVKHQLIAFHSYSSSLVAERLVLGSPILTAILSLCILIGLCNAGWQSLRILIKKSTQEMTSKIIDPRILDEEAARSAAAAA